MPITTAADARKAGHDVAREFWVRLEQRVVVDDVAQHLEHVVRLVALGGTMRSSSGTSRVTGSDDGLRGGSSALFEGKKPSSSRMRARRSLVVGGGEVTHAAGARRECARRPVRPS